MGEAGFRLVEHEMGWPAGYFLWCWENPHPERPVERIEFIPRGPRFIVAGVTTSDVDEHPFVRAPARPVRIVPKDGPGGVLDVEVDRGVAAYPQPLPGEDDRAGWGAAEGTSAYTSIAALPSATVGVRQGGDERFEQKDCWHVADDVREQCRQSTQDGNTVEMETLNASGEIAVQQGTLGSGDDDE